MITLHLNFTYISHRFTAREGMNWTNWHFSQCVASQLSWSNIAYRGGHGFVSHWSPDIFQSSSFQLLKLKNLLRWLLFTLIYNRSTIMNFTYISQHLASYAHVVQTATKQVNHVVERTITSAKCPKMKRETIVFCRQICKFVTFLLPSSLWLRLRAFLWLMYLLE